MSDQTVESPLLRMTQTTPTRLWNDSAIPSELASAIVWGAEGATCNPVLALSALKSDLQSWHHRIIEYAEAHPTATDSQIGWQMVRELSIADAKLLEPAFQRHGGVNGRLSVQTDPRLRRDSSALVAQAAEFDAMATNIIVKIAANQAGIEAIEEATYRGISINATVSFTVAQALAVGEAVERGLDRRESEGLDIASMGPVCTIMVGRLDDWLKTVAERDGVAVDPGVLDWAGVAVFKKAYAIYRARRYRTRLLSAAFRNHLHWSQFIGGDVVISPPYGWQTRLNASGIEPLPRIDDPVGREILNSLTAKFADFRLAYDEESLTPEDFEHFAVTRRTLRQFLVASADLEALVRDVLLPSPD